jgi:hypothetical protein
MVQATLWRPLSTNVFVGGMVAFVLASPAAAQSPLAGQWLVRYERELRSMHGGPPTVVHETARLSLAQQGDSLIGQWQAIVSSGETPPSARTVRGVIFRDTARVQIDPPPPENDGYFAELGRDIMEFLRTHIHDMPTMIPQLELTVRGDSLVGTRSTVSLDRQKVSAARPLSAVRDRP